MKRKVVVTGHGRSGTHWLAHVMGQFIDASHEPADYKEGGDVVVDCRLWRRIPELQREGYKLVHLIRDGRAVVRSTHAFYGGSYDFRHCCLEWRDAVNACRELPTVRLKDLLAKQAPTQEYLIPHWKEWTPDMHGEFWSICGEAMRRHGYEDDR